jgi:hypothetical protein
VAGTILPEILSNDPTHPASFPGNGPTLTLNRRRDWSERQLFFRRYGNERYQLAPVILSPTDKRWRRAFACDLQRFDEKLRDLLSVCYHFSEFGPLI